MNSKTNEFLDVELETVKENLDLEESGKSLSELDFKILKELNNEEEFRIYRRNEGGFDEFPRYFSNQVKIAVKASDDEFNRSVKKLFLKRYIDYSFTPEAKHEDMMKIHPSLTIDLLKRGTRLNEGFGGHTLLNLTQRGLVAMIDVSLKEITHLKNRFNSSIEKQENQIEELHNLSESVESDLEKTNSNVLEMKNRISKFNENIFTIFSLMIAAFAVIGINISSIPNIEDDFLLHVLGINLSVSFSLIVLFSLLKILIQKEKKSGLNWLLLGYGILLLVFTYLVLTLN